MVAGTHSGCGKTTTALALMAAFRARGYAVQPFKAGPDFIDPGHHRRVTGVFSRNLDGWMLSAAYNRRLFTETMQQADIAVVEGVMGLFDGFSGNSEAGSTAQIAKWLDLPVLLVVDARSMARSVAALVSGFVRFDPGLRFCGVVFNQVGGARHLAFLREAMESVPEVFPAGGLRRTPEIEIPERHLGLFTDGDHPLTERDIDRLARWVEDALDLTALWKSLPEIEPLESACTDASPILQTGSETAADQTPVNIGVARDNAFCFYYPDNLEWLERAGANLVFFSPAGGDDLPNDLGGLYLGGGYPELYADRLAKNTALRRRIRAAWKDEMPIFAECGGFMYLCESLTDLNDAVHSMAGCFPFHTIMQKQYRALGYREATTVSDSFLGPAGTVVRGHEFHYSKIEGREGAASVDTVFRITPRTGGAAVAEGYRSINALGGYMHIHFGSNPAAARCFVDACRRYRQNNRGSGNRHRVP